MERTLFETAEHTTEKTGGDERPVAISVVIPISEQVVHLIESHRAVSKILDGMAKSYEVIYVIDGPRPNVAKQLAELDRDPAVHVIQLNRWFGEATALAVGLEQARAATILTMPAYPLIEASDLPRVIEEFESQDVDLVIAVRHPRIDSALNRLQSKAFHWITGLLTGTRYRDVSSSVRVMDASVAEEVDLYGDLHRFFPLLAYQKGFRVKELPVRQNKENVTQRLNGPGVYLRRLLDILTLFFLFKFTKKPLRFFGLVGSTVFGLGSAIMIYLALYRLLHFGPIANRPLLILGALLIVLGLQLFSIGLLGEIMIFTHARAVKDYRVQEVRGPGGDDEGAG